MKKLTRPFLLCFLLATFIGIQKTQVQVESSNENIWFHYFGKNMVSSKLSFSFEATMRYANGFSEKQQNFIRPSVDYQFTKQFMGTIGYSHYNIYS